MEDYFNQSEAELKKDERPELSYQVGVTLENTEKPKCAVDEPCLGIIEALEPSERPLDISAHSPDPKCRFFWRMGDKPSYETQFPTLNAPNVVPAAEFLKERWTPTMEQWGNAMKSASVFKLGSIKSTDAFQVLHTLQTWWLLVLDCLLIFSSRQDATGSPKSTCYADAAYIENRPHLLAPTASDLVKYGKKDTILAGFHSDLNFLTIHGRSRYPGLNIWARNTGKRIPVKIPEGCNLLVQAGKQLEHITGGLIKAGFHEVAVSEQTLDVSRGFRCLYDPTQFYLQIIEKRRVKFPDRPLIRISSTFFWHLSSDYELVPIPSLIEKARGLRAEYQDAGKSDGDETVYPPMKVGQQVAK
jgi:hypothetical protein